MVLEDFKFIYDRAKRMTLVIPATGGGSPINNGQYKIPQDSDLDNNLIVGLGVETSSDSNATVINGVSVPNINLDGYSRVTISIASNEKDPEGETLFYAQDMPLQVFSNSVNVGKVRNCRWRINTGESYLQYRNPTGITAGSAFVLVWYILQPSQEAEYFKLWDELQAKIKARPCGCSSYCAV